MVVKTIRSSVPCPRCHQASSRVHSHHQRTIADLPWQGVSVQLQLATRRFFCVNQGRKQQIFYERLPRVVATYGRQRVRLNAQTSYGSVARYIRCIRQAQELQPRQEQATKLLPRVSEPQREPLTPRRAVWLVLRRSKLRKPEDEQLLRQLMAQHPHLAEAVELEGFAQMVRQRQPQQLEPWLAQAGSTSPFRRFAKGLSQDYAVKAGVTLPWSNGQTEGQVNRLKMLMRQMFGRVGIELLSRKFLLVA